MKKKEPLSRRLTFGIFYLLGSSFASLLLNVITIGFVARALGVENFGLYSAILSFVQLFQFLSDFGLNKTLLKFGSKDISKIQISFGNALFVKSILMLPTIFLIMFLGLLAGYRNEELFILLFFAVSLILDSYATVFSSIRRILGSFRLISFFRVLRTAINLVIIYIALTIKDSVLSLALANMLLSLVIFIVSLINTVIHLKPKVRIKLITDFFQDSVIFSLSDFFLNIYARISIVLLSFYSDLHSVGIFSAAIRFTKIANLLPAQVKFALLPTMYRFVEEVKDSNENKTKRIFEILLKYMGIFATIVAIGIFLFSDPIIHTVFGDKYNKSIPLVQLFSMFIYLRFIETPFKMLFIAMEKHKNMVFFQGLTSFLNVVLNFALIPSFSVYGAFYSTLISEIFFVLMLVYSGTKHSIWMLKDIYSLTVKSAIAGVICLSLILVFKEHLNIVIQLILFITSYISILFLLKTFDKSDKELFLKIFLKSSSS